MHFMGRSTSKNGKKDVAGKKIIIFERWLQHQTSSLYMLVDVDDIKKDIGKEKLEAKVAGKK